MSTTSVQGVGRRSRTRLWQTSSQTSLELDHSYADVQYVVVARISFQNNSEHHLDQLT